MRKYIIFLIFLQGCSNREGHPTFADTVSHPIIDTIKHIALDSGIRFTDSSFFFHQVEYKHKVVTIFGKKKFVVEGDLLLDSSQYFQYQLRQIIKQPRVPELVASEKLVIQGDVNGQPIRWTPGMVLNYAIIRASFGSEAEYQQVRANFEAACRQWEGVCNIKFQHLVDGDNAESLSPVGNQTFIVCELNVNGDFIAQSFFPDEQLSERRVLVDPTYFTTSYDHVGVFRHEIGHIVGFHHEHIRSGAPAACPMESPTGIIDLTQYDPQSVMHYYCGGVGDIRLRFSRVDTGGAIVVYGAPSH